MASRELIAPQTGAVSTQVPFDITLNRCPCTLHAPALTLAETVDVYISFDNGTTWDVLYVEGTAVQLTATDNAKTFYGPCHIGVTKSATAAAVGVYTTHPAAGKV